MRPGRIARTHLGKGRDGEREREARRTKKVFHRVWHLVPRVADAMSLLLSLVQPSAPDLRWCWWQAPDLD